MRKQEALHSSLQLRDVHDLSKVALHNGQLLGVALALVLGMLPLQCAQSGTYAKPSLQTQSMERSRRMYIDMFTHHHVVHNTWGIRSR